MRRSLLFCFVCCSFATPGLLLGQSDPDVVAQEKWKNGLLPTGTYGGSGATVNLHNGGLTAGLPLFSLPGRAGHNLSLTLSYNSKQLVREPYFDGEILKWRGRWFHKGPTAGRWVVSSWPNLSQTGQDGYTSTVYYFTTPDGAVHKLDWETGVTYTSRDGLNIRYNYVTRLIQFTGGAVFDFSLYAGQKKIIHRDRHGNEITYFFETAAGGDRPFKITDTLGREVFLYYDDPWQQQLLKQIVVKNHAGVDQTYTLGYVQKEINPAEWLYIPGYPSGSYYRYYGCDSTEVYGLNNLLASVTLPDGRSFQFVYDQTYIYYRSRFECSALDCDAFADDPAQWGRL